MLMTILLVILGVIVVIGIIRVIFSPYTGFLNLMLEVLLLDYLGDILIWIIEAISESDFDGW